MKLFCTVAFFIVAVFQEYCISAQSDHDRLNRMQLDESPCIDTFKFQQFASQTEGCSNLAEPKTEIGKPLDSKDRMGFWERGPAESGRKNGDALWCFIKGSQFLNITADTGYIPAFKAALQQVSIAENPTTLSDALDKCNAGNADTLTHKEVLKVISCFMDILPELCTS